MKALQLGIVLGGIDGQRQQDLGGFYVLHIEGCLLVDECQGILGLVVLSHVGRGNQDNGFTQ